MQAAAASDGGSEAAGPLKEGTAGRQGGGLKRLNIVRACELKRGHAEMTSAVRRGLPNRREVA